MLAESAAAPARYPVHLDVEWAEHQSRLQAVFRVILVIPAVLLLLVLTYGGLPGAIFLSWVIVLIRGRHPTWMFAFIVAQLRIVTRVYAYFFLLTDKYVVFEGEHPLSLDIDYPERTSRWQLFIWKYTTTLPHFFVLQFLQAAGLAISFVGWISIVFGGTYPKGSHAFATGVLRWQMRVVGYALSLTDVFPPYSIDADARPGSKRSLIVSAVVGALLLTALAGAITAVVLMQPSNEIHRSVSYEQLLEGTSGEVGVLFDNGVAVDLQLVEDPADPFGGFIVADEGERLLVFEMQLLNSSDIALQITRQDFRLVDSAGSHNTPIAVTIDDHRAPRDVLEDGAARIRVVFETGASGTPRQFRFANKSEIDSSFPGTVLPAVVYDFR